MYNNIFDSHAHYDDQQFDDDRTELLSSLPKKGVSFIIGCGCDIKSSIINQNLSHEFDYYYFSAGFHPENLNGFTPEDIDSIKTAAQDAKCVAIGEIGLDYHWMASDKQTQQDFFIKQIELAKELNLPVIVHDREAHKDTFDILHRYKPAGVLHCFSGSSESARQLVNDGMYIGLNGIATFKNARKSLETVKEIPIERLLLETDCPYCAPEPCRGKRNDSSLIPYIAQRIGDELGLTAQKVLDITNSNAKRLFKINQ